MYSEREIKFEIEYIYGLSVEIEGGGTLLDHVSQHVKGDPED
jgi:hypothetical protein